MLTWKMVLAKRNKMAGIGSSDDKAGNVYTRNFLLIKGLWCVVSTHIPYVYVMSTHGFNA